MDNNQCCWGATITVGKYKNESPKWWLLKWVYRYDIECQNILSFLNDAKLL